MALEQATLDPKLLLNSLTAVKNGDFSVRLPVEWSGVSGKIADAFNEVVEMNASLAAEIEKLNRSVGKEGKISQRATLQKGEGAWGGIIESVNSLVGDLVRPTTEIARVIGAVAKGDLTQPMLLEIEDRPLKGEFLRTAKTVNTMVEQLNAFSVEVIRVAREVGTEGKLGGQAKLKAVSGTWKELTDGVNSMASNLTGQVRNIAEVTVAVAGGDLSKKITVDVRGEFLQLKDTINTMVDQLRGFGSEVTRVAREVGTEGKLGGQAVVPGVWKDLTDNVNFMASNLTGQVRNIAQVTTAVAKGDLTRKITVDAKGEILELKNTINIMVDQLGAFASEVTRVAREVGTEGKLGGQAGVPGVAGTWKDLTDNVNFMAANLTSQVRNIAEVTTAVATGDLSKKITVDAKGEIQRLKETMNTMVDQLNSFASEVTRVAREVGTEGKLGGQAMVKGVSGTWKDLTENVNLLAGNLTGQVRNIALVTTAVANGDLKKKMTVDVKGEILELKTTINTMVDQLNSFASEVTRVAREVGTEGKLGGQAKVEGVSGTWKDLTENVNLLAGNLTGQVRNIAEVTTAVAKGDLNKKITVDAKGEILELKNTTNTMVDQLNSFAAEVTRVAREVGTEGKLGGQAVVKGVSGTWKDLTDSVNGMASNLTSQVRNLAEVTTAIASGDLSRQITVDVQGEFLQLKNTVNTMGEQLGAFASEVTRVAREVGTEGKLGGQAQVKGVSGTWKDLTDNVNLLAGNLTNQVRNIAQVTTAVATGDLTQKMTVEAKGEILELKNTINTMVDQLSGFASEVTRVAREVGTDGKLGGQGDVPGVSGTWKDLTDNVNYMAANLTAQVRNIAEVTTAVAKGELNRKITVDAKGEILELKNTINTMVDQLSAFASEVTRVAREVGTDGKLGGQAEVMGVSGTWKDLTDSVNGMASNLTSQVRNLVEVTTAFANGDLSRTITVDVQGEFLQLKNTVNTMVEQLGAFASEVTRVAREVGTEGKLGGQAVVKGVAGTWKDLTDNVNSMAGNLSSQVRNIAQVTTAVATGDLTKKITVDAQGEILELKNTINTMVDQLSAFASEVTRVAREVGTDGKLGGQGEVKGVSGTWKDLTDNVNLLAGNLTSQVRNIALVTTAVANGDLSKKITVEAKGEILELKDTINTMVDQLSTFASEVTRVAREVGTEGKLGGQAQVKGVAGTWKDLTDNVNSMAGNLTSQVRNIAQVTTAVATGVLTKKITVDVKGELMELKDTINTMVDQLSTFASEVTRVAREVGTEGKLGGQANVAGVAGTWKDLTDNVNYMAANLTGQVRNIAQVTTAVANGDLARKITVDARGEILELKDTINIMVDQLNSFASEVTRVAREVGVEGKLGGQANVPGAAGTWKDLTDNVNQLAANLTSQVRAIAEVATAVTKGDLTRSVKVEARGEVEELKNNVNEMIRNLKETTQRNTEQDWLKTNLAKFTRMLQGQRDLMAVSKMLLSELAPLVGGQHGVFYLMDTSKAEKAEPDLKLLSTYAYKERKNLAQRFKLGEGLVGQCAAEKERILLTNVPSDYVQITSGLGEAAPLNIVVLPVLFEGQVKGVVELASFEHFSAIHQAFLDQLTESIGIVLNTIEATSRTEELLKQSQSLTEELQSQQEELQQTNEELEDKARLLSEQKTEVERKNLEVEQAKRALEEKASQLALTSKYKSEFLSNMSHELRTPLNSLLLLSQQLTENAERNLTDKQVEFSRTIHSSGSELLSLINDILDLSKIESGTVSLELGELPFPDLRDSMERTFRHMAVAKSLGFRVDVDPQLPRALFTDAKRLQQVLKNLLSNAFKFTEKGEVALTMAPAFSGWSVDHEGLNRAGKVIAFSVTDTGIGIPPEKQKIIFEAFQQADGSTSRKYGGTGLGLTISREIAALLGGELRLTSSTPGQGSTFTLFVPMTYESPESAPRGGGPGGGGRPGSTPREGERTGTLSPRERGIGIFPRSAQRGDTSTSPRPAGRGEGQGEGTRVPSPRPSPLKGEGETKNQGEGSPVPSPVPIADDRNTILPGNHVLLIVEDDRPFAEILMSTAREKGFKVLLALDGTTGLALAREHHPDAVSLDLILPDVDGWTVLDQLKMDPETRHIPVQIISCEESRELGLKRGAFSFATKPVSREGLDAAFAKVWEFLERPVRNLLVVDDTEEDRRKIVELVGNGDVRTTAVGTAEEALTALRSQPFDCIVLDLVLPGMSGLEFLEILRNDPALAEIPVIVYTGKEIMGKEKARLEKLAKSIVIKDVRTPERLLDETALFLHRVTAKMPESKRRMLEELYQTDSRLAGKKVLIVDDDVRNIFALTSVLEPHKIKVLSAENGKAALAMLESNPGIDVVLMDIMMPEMDGYETMRAIRKLPQFRKLPIITLTAKAMKGDREKCIEAGASDYISKPVNAEQLLTLLRVWLYR